MLTFFTISWLLVVAFGLGDMWVPQWCLISLDFTHSMLLGGDSLLCNPKICTEVVRTQRPKNALFKEPVSSWHSVRIKRIAAIQNVTTPSCPSQSWADLPTKNAVIFYTLTSSVTSGPNFQSPPSLRHIWRRLVFITDSDLKLNMLQG